MAYYEQKTVNGNLYWYERALVAGKQTSRYIGKSLPPLVVVQNQEKFEADRTKEVLRHQIEEQIKALQIQASLL